MALLLNPRVWIALALAAVLTFAGFFLYRAGKASVRSDWNAQIAKDAQAAIAINNENQRIAGRWNATVIGALNAQKTRNARLEADAAGASAERDRLLDAARRAAAKRRLPSSPADAGPERADPLRLVLGACTAEVQELGRLADRHASDVQTLMEAWPRP